MSAAKLTKTERKRIDTTIDAFHEKYASAANWGQERWHDSLYPALLAPTRHAALVNGFASPEVFTRLLHEAGVRSESVHLLDLPQLRLGQDSHIQCIVRPIGPRELGDIEPTQGVAFPAPQASKLQGIGNRLLTHWNLDAASALAAHVLDVQPGHRVLDLCSAPGGKSIALAQCLWPHWPRQAASGCLHCNELDSARNKRLASNLKAYLPAKLLEDKTVRLFRMDGSAPGDLVKFPYGAAGYDRVLLDAPCSSERHVIQAQGKADASGRLAEDMARWKPGSSKQLAKVQAALLQSALSAANIGGRIVYATCSIETAENDGVVEQLLLAMTKEQQKGQLNYNVRFEVGQQAQNNSLNVALDTMTEITAYGRIALPDHGDGERWGPLYFSVITKISA